MGSRRLAAIWLVLGACGYPGLARLSGSDDAAGGDAAKLVDAPPGVLSITASPSSFDLHANDTRDTLLTVTNNTSQSGTPVLEAAGLTLGIMGFTSNTCTAGLPAGGSCT